MVDIQLTPRTTVNQFIISPHLLEPGCSSPRSRHPATGSVLWMQSTTFHHISSISTSMLHSRAFLSLQSGALPSGLSTKILHAFLFSSMRATCPGSLIVDLISRITFGEEKFLLNPLLSSFPELLVNPLCQEHAVSWPPCSRLPSVYIVTHNVRDQAKDPCKRIINHVVDKIC